MADERIGGPETEERTYWGWTELFRTFQVALDPKKLLLAAVGILVMFAGWWVLSRAFYGSRSAPKDTDYSVPAYQTKYGLSEPEAKLRKDHDYDADLKSYQL